MFMAVIVSLFVFFSGCEQNQPIGKPLRQRGAHSQGSSDKVRSITGGGLHVCAHLDDHTITCWGDNQDGQCNLKRARNASKKIYDISHARFSKISAGGFFSCGILMEDDFDGIPICFGQDGAWLDVPHEKVKDISVGSNYTCFIKEDDRLACVGVDVNLIGSGGSYTISTVDLPKHGVSEGIEHIDYSQKKFKNIKAIGPRMCAQDLDGIVFCMGSNIHNTGGSIKEKVLDYRVDLMGTQFILENGKLKEYGKPTLIKEISNITNPYSLIYKRFLDESNLLTAAGNFYADGSVMPENTLISSIGYKEEGVLDAIVVESSRSLERIGIRCVVKATHKVQCKPHWDSEASHREADTPVIKNIPPEILY